MPVVHVILPRLCDESCIFDGSTERILYCRLLNKKAPKSGEPCPVNRDCTYDAVTHEKVNVNLDELGGIH